MVRSHPGSPTLSISYLSRAVHVMVECRAMGTKFYRALLVTAALYILAFDFWTAIYGTPGAASPELGGVAISQGMVVPE